MKVSKPSKNLENVLKVNQYLEFLYIGGNSLKNEGLKYILHGLNNNTSLHILDVSNNEITSAGISYFTTVLKVSKLNELDLSENLIGNEGIEILGNCINSPSLNTLRTLNLNQCKIDFVGAYNFFYNLKNNKKLEVLNLSKNNLSSDKFGELRTYLNIINLKELKLNKCKIGNLGAAALADGLCNNNSLKVLEINDNKIDDDGFHYFKEVPLKNSSLEVLDISRNSISVKRKLF